MFSVCVWWWYFFEIGDSKTINDELPMQKKTEEVKKMGGEG